jgi:hypothetical protein
LTASRSVCRYAHTKQMSDTPHIDKLLVDAEAAAARQSSPTAIEHILVALLRKAKTDPKLADALERIYPVETTTLPKSGRG